MDERQRGELIRLIDANTPGDGVHSTAVPGLSLVRLSRPGTVIPTVYEPLLCLVVQGSKQILLGERVFSYEPPEFLLVSVDLPVIGRIVRASRDEPYLAAVLSIDLPEYPQLVDLAGRTAREDPAGSSGLLIGRTEPMLAEGMLRLARLLETSGDIPYLAPLAKAEVFYRLLTGEHGGSVARLAVPDGSTERIARVIGELRSNYQKPLKVESLAELAHMSQSAFHQHFKRLTSLSPLQYQKRRRLLEARRLMLGERASASAAARQVGYESISQFSREYSRMFGAPPTVDRGLRHAS